MNSLEPDMGMKLLYGHIRCSIAYLGSGAFCDLDDLVLTQVALIRGRWTNAVGFISLYRPNMQKLSSPRGIVWLARPFYPSPGYDLELYISVQ